MTILSVSNKKGYLSFLVDEISYRKEGYILFPCRDDLIIKNLRDCLDELHIVSSLIEDARGRPTTVIEEVDSIVKICFSCGNFIRRRSFESLLKEKNLFIGDVETPDKSLDIGWFSALMDLKVKVYPLPKPRLLIRSNKTPLIARASSVLNDFSINHRIFDCKSYLSISIGRRDDIKKVLSMFPLNIRVKQDMSNLVLSFTSNPK